MMAFIEQEAKEKVDEIDAKVIERKLLQWPQLLNVSREVSWKLYDKNSGPGSDVTDQHPFS